MNIEPPELLRSIPNPPKTLYITGVNIQEVLSRPRIAIVGSRKVTPYGKTVTALFASELAKQGVVIVSGLALGVDTLAHRAAIEAGGLTVAVLPTGLDKIYPSSNQRLAQAITKQGLLLTEYPEGTRSFKGNFIARNRLVSGISDAIIITEAAEQSGTLHTAAFAKKQGRSVFAVPGNITSPLSKGANQLIKSGATAITDPQDILDFLGITAKEARENKPQVANPNEQTIVDLLYSGITEGAILQRESKLDIQNFSQSLTMLELSGIIKPLGNNHWSLQ